jgi:hypothetical protein
MPSLTMLSGVSEPTRTTTLARASRRVEAPHPSMGNDRRVRTDVPRVTLIDGRRHLQPFIHRPMMLNKDSDRMPGLTMLPGRSKATKKSNLDFRTVRIALCLFLVLFPLSLFGAGHDISAVRYASPNLYVGPSRVVANGGRLLTVWAMSDEYPRRNLAYGAVAETVDGPLSRPFLLPGVTGSPSPLSPWGSGFIGLWWTQNHFDIVTLLANGDVQRVTHVPRIAEPPRFATNGHQLLVVDVSSSSSSGPAYATLYEADGTRIAQTILSAPSVAYVDVARAGNSYVVVTAGWAGEVHFYRFDDRGTLIADRELQAKPPPYALRAPLIAVAGDASHTVVAWTRTESSAAFVASVSSNNEVGALQPLPIKNTYPKICVVPTASGYLIVWSEDRAVSGVRTTAAGQLVDGTAIPIAPGYLQEATAAGDQFALITTPQDGNPLPLSMVSGRVLPQGVSASVVSPIVTSAAARQDRPVIASDGVDYVAAWIEHDGTDLIAMVGRVTRSGVPLDGTGIPLPVPSKEIQSVSITRGAGGDALVLVSAGGASSAFRWSRAAGLVDKTPINLDSNVSEFGTAVAWNGVSYLALWVNAYPYTLTGRFIGGDGTAGAKFTIPMAVNSFELIEARNPAVAWDGRQFLISVGTAFTIPCGTLCGPAPSREIRLLRLTATGSLLDKLPYRLTNATDALVATSGREFLLLTRDYYSFSPVIVHADANGLSVTAPIMTVPDARASDVTWDGAYYDVAWTGIGGFLRLWRLDSSAHVQQKVFVTGPDGIPSVTSNDAGEIAIGLAEAAPPSNLSRARIYFDSELQPVPPALATPTNLVGHMTGPDEALLHWEGDAPGYLVEWRYGNVWFEQEHLPGNINEATVYAHLGDTLRIRAYGPDGVSPDGAVITIHSEPRTRTVRR